MRVQESALTFGAPDQDGPYPSEFLLEKGNKVLGGKPDGSSRKPADVTKLERLGWRGTRSLADGLTQTYADYLENTVNTNQSMRA